MKDDYILNNIRTKIVKNKVLLTTDHGGWLSLTKEEYDQLLTSTINNDLKQKLLDSGIILTEENMPKVIETTKKKNEHMFQGPTLHIVVPTLRCNQKCIYCHAKAKAPEAQNFDMDKDTAEKTVDFIFKSPSQYITIEFQGGEPLLNFEIVKHIVKYAKKLNEKKKKQLEFGIVTNLTLMTDDILDFLVEERIGICTSLDGPEKLHNSNRPYKENSHKNALEWIKKIQKVSKLKPNALMVVTKDSLQYPKEIVDTYVENNLSLIQLKFLTKLGNALNVIDKVGYKPEEFLTFWKTAMDYIIDLNKQGKNLQETLSKHMIKKILTKENSNFVDLQSPCGGIISQLAYTQDGDVHTCDEGRMYDIFKLGNVKENSFKEIMTSNTSCSFIATSINDGMLCDACVFKPYCGVCPVCNYSEDNNIIPLLSTNYRCQILKGMFDYLFDKILNDKETLKIFKTWLESPIN